MQLCALSSLFPVKCLGLVACLGGAGSLSMIQAAEKLVVTPVGGGDDPTHLVELASSAAAETQRRCMGESGEAGSTPEEDLPQEELFSLSAACSTGLPCFSRGLVGFPRQHVCAVLLHLVSDLGHATVLLQQPTQGKVRAQLVMLLRCVTAVCSAL